MSKNAVLVTGGAGFIGSHLSKSLAEDGYKVIILDDLRTGKEENIKIIKEELASEGRKEQAENIHFVKGSITDKKIVEQIFTQNRIDYVFNLAALVSVAESMEKPDLTVEINTKGVLVLLEQSRKSNIKKFFHASSAAVYGDSPKIPKVETMRPEPKSPYAITKLDGEYFLEMYRLEHKMPTVSLRFFNVYGPRQDPKSQYAAAIPIFIWRALRNEDIVIFGDGLQTRDFIYVGDIVRAIKLVTIEKPDAHWVYNAARGGRITILELAKKIIQLTGSKSRIVHDKPRPGDVRHSQASIKRIKKLGFKPQVSLEEGLRKTIEFFKDQI